MLTSVRSLLAASVLVGSVLAASPALAEDEAQSAAWRRRNGRAGRLPNGRPGWILESGPRGVVSYASRAHTIYYEMTGP